MIPSLPLTMEIETPNHEGLSWAVWVLKDAEGRRFLRGRDKSGLETVMMMMNEWRAARDALFRISMLGFTAKVGERYREARAIARAALDGMDYVEVA